MSDRSNTLMMFAGFSTVEASAAAPFFQSLAVEDGRVLFNEGDPGSALCIVDRGTVAVLKGEREIARIVRGRAFGEMSVLDGRPRSATCRAIGPCKVLTLGDASLRRMLKERPEIAAKMLFALASSITSRLRRTNKQLPESLWGA